MRNRRIWTASRWLRIGGTRVGAGSYRQQNTRYATRSLLVGLALFGFGCSAAGGSPEFGASGSDSTGGGGTAGAPCTGKEDGTVCDDSDACTTDDACAGGLCAGLLVVCTAGDTCHGAGTCDPSTGACPNPPLPDGAACDDGSACTKSDSCHGGVCIGSNVTTLNIGAATYPPTSSGVTLTSGLSVVVTVTGTWSVGGPYGTFDANGTTYSTQFEPCSPVPTSPMGMLVGSLDGTTWIPIGVGPTTITGDGTLLLSANDCAGPGGTFFSDNSGAVTVTLEPSCDEPVPQ